MAGILESPAEETFEISMNLGNNLIQYLGHRPYVEVVGLIQQLQVSANVSAQAKIDAANAKKEDENHE